MQRKLGRTGLHVSSLAFGTVALGTSYGFVANGSPQPSGADALCILRGAAAGGITLFDTAPAYGTAEALLGEALGANTTCIFATKVSVATPEEGAKASADTHGRRIRQSLEASRHALRRDVLDIVQIHNATSESLALPGVRETLEDAREKGVVRFVGASVYTESEALAAIDCGWIDVLQVPYSILDQRIATTVLDAAQKRDVGVITRSALLKGALTERAMRMPAALSSLQSGVERAKLAMGVSWHELPEIALRFCLTDSRVSSVLVGASKLSELKQALSAVAAGPLPEKAAATAATLSLGDANLVDPRRWPVA